MAGDYLHVPFSLRPCLTHCVSRMGSQNLYAHQQPFIYVFTASDIFLYAVGCLRFTRDDLPRTYSNSFREGGGGS